jgi:hypothetical protein
MAKVVIIDVDLGLDLDAIITESAKQLTKDAKDELDQAIAVMDSAKKLKEEADRQKNEAITGIDNAMTAIYDKLVSAGSNGISVEDIMESVKAFIPNSSAFSLRMNNVLSKRGNPYRLIRAKVNGKPHYVFTPFNN